MKSHARLFSGGVTLGTSKIECRRFYTEMTQNANLTPHLPNRVWKHEETWFA